jgi:hypothetical protein
MVNLRRDFQTFKFEGPVTDRLDHSPFEPIHFTGRINHFATSAIDIPLAYDVDEGILRPSTNPCESWAMFWPGVST